MKHGIEPLPLTLSRSAETLVLNDDKIEQRLLPALIVSLCVNAALWWGMSGFVHSHIIAPPVAIEVQRVVLNKDKKIVPMKLKPKVLPRPKPKVAPPKPVPVRHVDKTPPPPPPVQHLHVMAAVPSPSGLPNEPTVAPGGTATPGTSAPAPVPEPTPEAKPAPVTAPAPAPKPEPEPAPAPEPKPVVVPPPPPPAPPPGPTKDAQPGNQVNPEIPEELKQSDYKAFVRVKVVVSPDGSFTPTLRTSSGNAEIDRRVLDALKHWTWKPALKDGKPVESTAYFRFEFEVN